MLGIGLFFVGITLIINGWGSLLHIDYRSLALINLFTGTLSFIINLIYMLQGAYYEAGTGFLFAFTYLLVGIIYLFDLDLRIYGIFLGLLAMGARSPLCIDLVNMGSVMVLRLFGYDREGKLWS